MRSRGVRGDGSNRKSLGKIARVSQLDSVGCRHGARLEIAMALGPVRDIVMSTLALSSMYKLQAVNSTLRAIMQLELKVRAAVTQADVQQGEHVAALRQLVSRHSAESQQHQAQATLCRAGTERSDTMTDGTQNSPEYVINLAPGDYLLPTPLQLRSTIHLQGPALPLSTPEITEIYFDEEPSNLKCQGSTISRTLIAQFAGNKIQRSAIALLRLSPAAQGQCVVARAAKSRISSLVLLGGVRVQNNVKDVLVSSCALGGACRVARGGSARFVDCTVRLPTWTSIRAPQSPLHDCYLAAKLNWKLSNAFSIESGVLQLENCAVQGSGGRAIHASGSAKVKITMSEISCSGSHGVVAVDRACVQLEHGTRIKNSKCYAAVAFGKHAVLKVITPSSPTAARVSCEPNVANDVLTPFWEASGGTVVGAAAVDITTT